MLELSLIYILIFLSGTLTKAPINEVAQKIIKYYIYEPLLIKWLILFPGGLTHENYSNPTRHH